MSFITAQLQQKRFELCYFMIAFKIINIFAVIHVIVISQKSIKKPLFVRFFQAYVN